MQKTAIIIPCYNEALRLNSKRYLDFTKIAPDIHFIFVDDGSTDETWKALDDLSRSCPGQIESIRLGKNSGKAEAVRRGYLKAFEGQFANIGFWDADLATPLEIIPTFCEILETPGINMVIGSRVRLLGRSIQRRAIRHYLGRLFATGASIVLGLPVYDTQCGAKIFKNCTELRMVFSRPFTVKWTFDVEILARFTMIDRSMGTTRLRHTAVEYPLEEWIDVPGSKIKAGDFLRGAYELCKIFLGIRSMRRT